MRPSLTGQRAPQTHTQCPPPIPSRDLRPECVSGLQAVRSNSKCPIDKFLSRRLANMEPGSGAMGTRWVKDDKSQPSGQAESTNIHLHLIHRAALANHWSQPSQGARGVALSSPCGSKKLWDDGRCQNSQSCQQARGGPSSKGEGGCTHL